MPQEQLNLLTNWVWNTEGGKLNRMLTELYAGSVSSGSTYKYTYGACIANFLKKLNAYKLGLVGAKAPTIVAIGDSMFGGTWLSDLATYLNTNYSFPIANLTIYTYGGQGMDEMLPQIEDCIIRPNPDLIIFGEYETTDSNDELLHLIENVFSLIRERTSADVMYMTWGMYKASLQGFVIDPTTIADDTDFKRINHLRHLAHVNNFEVVDTNWALIQYALAGGNLNTIYSDTIHLNSTGQATIFYAEFIKHFNTPVWIENLNCPYPLRNKEELIFFSEQLRFKDSIKSNIAYDNEANWSISDNFVISTNATSYITIDITDSIGFEVVYGNVTGQIKIEISSDGGSTYDDPSELTFNSKPLQYATPGYTSSLRAPVKHIIVKNNILADGTLESGNYNMKVTNVSGNDITITVYDPNNDSLGTFLVGQTELDLTDLKFALSWNGEANYYLDQVTSAYVLNNNFLFKIKSNWKNTINTASGSHARVYGFARDNYRIRLTLNSGSCKLLGINVFH